MVFLLCFASVVATLGHTFMKIHFNDYSSSYAEMYLIIFWIFAVSGLTLKQATYTTLSMICISAIGIFYVQWIDINSIIMHLFWMCASFSFGFAGAYLLESSNRTIFAQQRELHQEISNKNILLKELAHRVKNNLQIVSSILYSHSKEVSEAKTKEIFKNSIQTVKAMGMIHERLFESHNLNSINFENFIQNLINLINKNMSNNDISFSFNSQKIIISIENAVPLGLIVNEILTNSIKYAQPINQQKLLIKIAIIMDKEETIHLHISDNGETIALCNQKKGFGTQLINSLIHYQIKGEIDTFNNQGLHYNIRFKDKK